MVLKSYEKEHETDLIEILVEKTEYKNPMFENLFRKLNNEKYK
jgi:hypothetical protein